ncbi:MAG: hypothetical protein JO249_04625 [Acidobacteria bacterium]|nr:hypothetical protein [Acidobacteriota bacterium]
MAVMRQRYLSRPKCEIQDIADLSLAASTVTAWFALFRHGTVKVIQSIMIFFGLDTLRAYHDTLLSQYIFALWGFAPNSD